jgi:hypothetical protein
MRALSQQSRPQEDEENGFPSRFYRGLLRELDPVFRLQGLPVQKVPVPGLYPWKNRQDAGPMKITAAAILERGRVWTGLRHHEIIRDIVAELGLEAAPILGEQGFVTDDGRFVEREEAAKIAFAAGQIPGPKKVLFSEDIFKREKP